MATGGTNVSPYRKGTLCFSRYIDASVSASVTLKSFLCGSDDDVGYTFDSAVKITRVSWQAAVIVVDATETLTLNVCKGDEATVVYTSGALDVASLASLEGSDTTPATAGLEEFATDEDLIVVAVLSTGSDTAEVELNVQIDYEYIAGV